MSDFDAECPLCGLGVKLRSEYRVPPFGTLRRFEYHRLVNGCELDSVYVEPDEQPRAARPFAVVRGGVLEVVTRHEHRSVR